MKWYLLLALLLLTACPRPQELTEYRLIVDQSLDGSVIAQGAGLTLSGHVESSNSISGVYLSINGLSPENIGAETFSITRTFASAGMYQLILYAIDNDGLQTVSLTYLLQVTNGTESSYGAGDLLINEVGSTYYEGVSSWFEVYNNTALTVDLSDLMIATPSSTKTSPFITSQGRQYFSMPSTNLLPYSFMLIRGRINENNQDGPAVIHISKQELVPFWTSQGFVEIVSMGNTVDFVSFGENSELPLTASWNGSAPALIYSSAGYGQSIARDATQNDTDSYTDWQAEEWATPGGTNDITDNTDSDNDGIPDQAEMPGGTFAGLPLYDWGARVGVRDLFVHIDYMDSTDLGVTPRKEALEKVKLAFSNQNIALHLDTGDLYHSAGGSSPPDFDLDDKSHKVPYSAGVVFGRYSSLGNIYEYKARYMDIRRKQVFHYCLFGDTQYDSGPYGSSGVAEIDGNDFIITLGQWSLSDSSSAELNKLINWQAATLMHEFGHNLGLRHGGFENGNYKPNYYSIMNYEYQLWGLPHTNSVIEGDRYYYRKNYLLFESQSQSKFELLDRGPTNVAFLIDYSGGLAQDINEYTALESQGLRQSWSQGVDWNGDGDLSDTVSMDLNGSGLRTLISDYDDWNNLNFFFMRNWQGDNQGASIKSVNSAIYQRNNPIINDKQELIHETLNPNHQE